MAETIHPGIYWIGVSNPESEEFHGIATPRGGSYNSYLILDEKPTLIDTTNTPFLSEYMESLRGIIDPVKISYIVVNHAEPDHNGAIAEILKRCSNAQILCTAKGKEMISAAYGITDRVREVKEKEKIPLGKRSLTFYPIPMVHWPESMMTFCEPDKILFPNDLFGTEIGHEAAFADQMKPFQELTRDYFAIVFRPFAMPVNRAIQTAKALSPEIIAPSHGPAYRKDTDRIIAYYEQLAIHPEEKKACIIYSSIWHSNELMAHEIAEGIRESGYGCSIHQIEKSNCVKLMAEALTSEILVLGSLTIAGGYHPAFETLFLFLALNNQKGKISAVFGTHGWASAAVPKLTEKLKGLSYSVVGTLDMRFGPHSTEDMQELKDFGKRIAAGAEGNTNV